MKNKALKISFILVFILLIIFSYTSSTLNIICAKTNESYGGTSSTAVADSNLDKKVNDSAVTGALASFVYSIASLVENLVGNVFTSLSGDPEFPWADRIIFNAVPLLDINFFNPSDNSFFKRDNNDTPVAVMVRNTYFTVLAISIAFLTIVVAIAAIKMALTTLATEKAKYKEAITKWMFSIVLIFLMHNLMSFIFFLNEGLVEVASNILSDRLEDGGVYNLKKINENLQGEVSDEILVKNFIRENTGITTGDITDEGANWILSDEGNIAMAAYILKDSYYREEALKYASDATFGDAFKNAYSYIINTYTPFNIINGRMDYGEKWTDPVPILVSTMGIAQDKATLENYKETWYKYKGKSKEEVRLLFEESNDLNIFERWNTTTDFIYNTVQFWLSITQVAESANANFHYDEGLQRWVENTKVSDGADIIKTMASIFKSAAYTYPTDDMGNITGWSPSKLSVTGALLYAIFVFQSILYLFSYIKRFFYIVILAIFAPIIVLFDFLGKALS